MNEQDELERPRAENERLREANKRMRQVSGCHFYWGYAQVGAPSSRMTELPIRSFSFSVGRKAGKLSNEKG